MRWNPLFTTAVRLAATALISLTLSGCGGGGGGGGGSNAAPTVANQPPTASAGADHSANERDTATLDGSASRDSDGTISTYQWRQVSGLTVTINNSDQATADYVAPEVTPANEDLVFEITISDNSGATASDTVTVSVVNVNLPPVADAGGDRSEPERTSITLDASASNDPDVGIASYEWNQLSGQTVTINNSGEALAEFTTPEVSPSNEDLMFKVTVTDTEGAMASDTVTISVVNVNLLPVADAGGDRSEPERTSITLDASASNDPDVGIASYEWNQLSGQTVTINNSGEALAEFTTPEVSPSNEDLMFQVTVTDTEGAMASDTVTISVVNVNIPPTANAGADQFVYEGTTVVLDAAGSTDQDGIITDYFWRLSIGPVVDIPNPDQPQFSFVAPDTNQVYTNEFELTVTDELGGTSTDFVSIIIRPIIPPIADAGADQVVESESTVVLTALASSDVDGEIISYQWTQLAGPAVNLSDSATPETSFTAPLVSENTVVQFELTVIDDSDATATDVIDVTVTPPTYIVSGTITVPDGNIVDSDVNDWNAAYQPNDSPDTAQFIPNPVTVGGYANRRFWGPSGRSQLIGDVNDYYRVVLTAGQTISMRIGNASEGDLDVYLWDQSGTGIVDFSIGIIDMETVTAPSDGEYVIEVYAYSGASNYLLNVETPGTPAFVSSGFNLRNDFMPNEVIVRYHDRGKAPQGNKTTLKPQLTSSLGVRKLAGESTRAMLYALSPDLGAIAQAASLEADEIAKRSAALSSDVQREKWKTLTAIKLLGGDPSVRYAEPNYIRHAAAVPDDEFYDRQWHYPFINVPAAWDITMGDPAVSVAVIDTGVLVSHPDLQGQLVDGYDFISSTSNSNDGDGIDPDPDDPGDGCGETSSSFHGTHVSGTIAASTNNAIGVAGIAGGSKIMPLRALGCNGGTSYDIGQAVLFAAGLANDSGIIVDDPSAIINLSLGGGSKSRAEQEIFNAARSAGVIVVAAAGNSATSAPHFPSGYDGVISVSAVGVNGVRASYSNFGSDTDVTAPGGAPTGDFNNDGYADSVYSTDGEDSTEEPLEFTYEFKMGTSMATPHVAGVLALMKSVNSDLLPADIDAMLVRGDIVDEIGALGWDPFYGWGLIDAQKAVTAAIDAIGNPPSENPAMDVAPRSVHFGAFTSIFEFEVVNRSGGQLVVGEIAMDPAVTWLSIEAVTVDTNGVGTYAVTVDRAGLSEGTYTAVVSIASNANTVYVAATMLVPPVLDFTGDAGQLYVVLVDAETGESFYGAIVTRGSGIQSFQIAGVLEGTYEVVAGSDSDNDFTICDAGESCGRYPDFGNPTQIIINTDTGNIDFPVSYDWFLPAQVASKSGKAAPGISR